MAAQNGAAGGTGDVRMKQFCPDQDACVPTWINYKREFLVNLTAAGLDDKPGKRQVNTLLKNMGIDCIKLYDTFEWAPEVVPVVADENAGVVAVEGRPAEDKNKLEDVFKKFDTHWGVKRYRSIKRQEFLDVIRGTDQSIMDFVAELKRKAELCDYGEQKESFIVDKIINCVGDDRCSERLLDTPDEDLTLTRVISICRQVELTKAHLKLVHSKTKDVKKVYDNRRGRARGRGAGNFKYQGQFRQQDDSRHNYRQNWRPDDSRHNSRQNWRQDDSRHNSSNQSWRRDNSGRFCDKCCKHHQEGECRASSEYCGACGERGHFRKSVLCKNYRHDGFDNRRVGFDNRRGGFDNRRGRFDNRRGYNRGRSRGRGQSVHNVYTERDDDLHEDFNDRCNVEDIFSTLTLQENSDKCDNCDEHLNDNDTVYCDTQSVFDDNDVHCDALSVDDDVYCDAQSMFDDDDVYCDAQSVFDDDDVYCDAQSVFDDDDVYCDAQDGWCAHCDVQIIDELSDVSVVQSDIYDVLNAQTQASDWQAIFDVSGQQLKLEIDTAAHCNVISLNTLRRLGLENQISKSNVLINGVHNEARRPFGCITISCKYRNKKVDMEFQVLDSTRDINLIGRIDSVKLNLVARVHSVAMHQSCEKIVKLFSDVLGDEIGCIPGEYDVKIDDNVRPVVHPPRSVPAAIREQVKKELDHLENCGILTKVTEPTEWVNSMVTVRKKNGRVRICIDPSDLNHAIKREHFPMNTIEDIATRLHGSQLFSTLDANSGYFQIRLTEQSSKLTTFNTPFGRYRYLRMPMGLKCSAEVFQRQMLSHFGDIDGVEIVVDDILVHGRTAQEHNDRLTRVLERARKLGLKLNKDKSKIGLQEVNYVGHRLTSTGLKPTQERIDAIVQMRPPENFQEVETVLGMIAYVSKFIPGLSSLNAPLRDLKKSVNWYWTSKEQKAYDEIKQRLSSDPILKYYDVNKPVTVSVDASMRGLGAALLQENAVVAYASRSLSDTERRYAQIEKEALAVVFGCVKFHKMIYGKTITIESDHKPLETIMHKPIHAAPMRIQRMMLKLQPYSFQIVHVKGKNLGLADCLSRLPCGKSEKTMDDELMVCPVDTIIGNHHSKFLEATRRDEELQKLKRVVLDGWPEVKGQVSPEITGYWNHRDEIGTYNGLLFKGDRVIVPQQLRREMIGLLHKSHMGTVLMKQRARDVMFWPGMSSQLEDVASQCSTCLKFRNQQPKEPMMVHPIPSRPWSKIGADLFELDAKHYLLLVDYYSNYVEVEKLGSLTSTSVIQMMKRNIARYGIMDTLVSDNGPQFSSRQFADFAKEYGFELTTSSPLRPQSNGLAERSIQTVKRLMLKCSETGEDFYLALLDWRNTPRDSMMGSPSQRLMGRRTQTRLPTSETLLKPSTVQPDVVTERLRKYKTTQKMYYDTGKRRLPAIQRDCGLRVYTPQGWRPAEYLAEHDLPRSHVVRSGDQLRQYRRNRDQLMMTRELPHDITVPQQLPYLPPRPRPVVNDRQNQGTGHNVNPLLEQGSVQNEADVLPQARPAVQTRSGRTRTEPAYLKDFVRY